MNTKNFPWKNSAFWSVVLVAIVSVYANAQTNVSNTQTEGDEQIIRDLVKKQNESSGKSVIPVSDNRIYVSGAYQKPIINGQLNEEDQKRSEKMKAKRLNNSKTDRIERVVVSQSGDMAYEFGYSDMAWDTPEKRHVSFEASYLRIWRKLDGQWKIEVTFARPNMNEEELQKMQKGN